MRQIQASRSGHLRAESRSSVIDPILMGTYWGDSTVFARIAA
ncbi:hypothetical protein AS9A_3262 [Hoyosella subflava DQS3-9A1]|uniref:Uncharacterized protein n=1 Tax=Hoyosella subflava (strain DSM 45089 / JCM 17490 / NBRC 109087 / DQS3-9A1) TaxID=443218 RepID=F6ENN8_HOYSD|nr:hypothetical protein AS9A_3262 [Hoyosella subflava DQS3-9A1]